MILVSFFKKYEDCMNLMLTNNLVNYFQAKLKIQKLLDKKIFF